MSMPREGSPTPHAPGPGASSLGRISLRLGIATLICGILAGLLWLPLDGTWYGALSAIGFPLGVAAIVTGIIAITSNRGRRQGVIALVLAVVSGPAAFILQLASYVIGYAIIRAG